MIFENFLIFENYFFSRDFDTLYCQTPEKLRYRYLIVKGILYFEDQLRHIMQQQQSNAPCAQESEQRADNEIDQKNSNDERSTGNINDSQLAPIFRRLGHLHLLAQDYPKGKLLVLGLFSY